MIIPLGHEEQLARRWPWVSVVIILLSFLGWAFLRTPMAEGELRVAQAQARARAFAQVHSYTNPGPCRALTDPKLMGGGGYDAHNSFLSDFPKPGVVSAGQADDQASADERAAAAEAELTRLCRAYDQELSESVKHQLGYVPGRSSWVSLITYQFVDDGFLHLIFGMWFLWLAGAVLEDGWGRLVYPAFYVSGGICAAIFYKLAEPQTPVPLLGASGGVAAAVGAFLVRHPKAESRMLIWIRYRPRFISAPAYVMVGLWLGIELIGAMFFSLVESNAGSWAQFVGFGFGMLFAAGMRWTGAEKRLDDAIERRVLEPEELTAARVAAQNAAHTAPPSVSVQLPIPAPRRSAEPRPPAPSATGQPARQPLAYPAAQLPERPAAQPTAWPTAPSAPPPPARRAGPAGPAGELPPSLRDLPNPIKKS